MLFDMKIKRHISRWLLVAGLFSATIAAQKSQAQKGNEKETAKRQQENLLGDDGVKLLQELARERAIKASRLKESASTNKNPDELWDYHGITGPEHWHDLHKNFSLCGQGNAQSPIDIPEESAKSNLNIEFNYEPSSISLYNNGKTLLINYFAKAKIMLNKRKFKLVRLQFRTPSEHLVSGIEYPMEIQFYHRSADNTTAIVSVFVQAGQNNALLENIWNVMPEHINRETIVREKSFDANLLFPQDRTFYFYRGSLTTPPCTENVQWIIFANPIEASAEQLEIFSTILNNNRRPIQETNNRPVRIDS
jgi:carbonic anhydrase